MENQLVLKSNIFLTNFVSILMTLQLGLGFLSLTSLITVSAGAFLQLVVFYCCMYFQYFLMKKYRIGT
jgi:heme A synthase